MRQFLQETLHIAWWAFFQPTRLEYHLDAAVPLTDEEGKPRPTTFLIVLEKLGESLAARRLLAQFALLWRWTYGHAQVETGAALLLDKATGVELAELEKRGLIGRVDNNRRMVLYGPEERPGLIEQTTNRLRTGSVPLIDLIHCAALLWRDNQREQLNELLAEQGDAMRRVAQALAEIQRNGHSERRLTLGFLGAWPAGLTPKMQAPPSKRAQIKEQQLPFDLDTTDEPVNYREGNSTNKWGDR